MKFEGNTGSPMEDAEAISERLNKINSILSLLGVSKETISKIRDSSDFVAEFNGVVTEGKISLKNVLKEVDMLYDKIKSISNHRKSFDDKIAKINEKINILERFIDSPLFKMDLSYLSLESINVFAGFSKDPQSIESLISSKTKNFSFWSKEDAFVLACDSSVDLSNELKSATLIDLLSLFDFSDIGLFDKNLRLIDNGKSNNIDTGKSNNLKNNVKDSKKNKTATRKNNDEEALSFSSLYKLLLQEKTKLENEKRKVVESFSIHERTISKLLMYQKYLLNELEKQEAPLLFGESEASFVVQGYVPRRKVPKLKSQLDKVLGKKFYLTEEYVDRHHEAPISLNHNKIVSPFDFFVNLYSLPSYGEIDPTIFTFISFPLIFGAMLGDMGYGLFSLFLFLYLKHKLPKFKSFFDILVWSSLWTILFGLIFGEFFGAEEIFGFKFHPLIHRMHDINSLMAFAIVIGLVHINIGFILGFINEYKHHGLWHAFSAKMSWIILQVGVAVIALTSMNLLDMPQWIGILLTVVPVVLIAISEGMAGIVEIPGIFGNILSYLRIMAIGLASAGLAVVVNDFATNFFRNGVVGIVPGLLLLIVGHAINILLGLFGPFLHSLRLHYVEQFSKFYKGGGVPYKPFGEKN
jgi:vacuolar-type H+-ATPase subunit I/STV1